MFVRAPLYKRREENQLVAAECFIALIICSTCFGHVHAHHQELETILVLLPHMVCNALVAGGRRSGAPDHRPPASKALHIIHSVASSWFSSLRTYTFLWQFLSAYESLVNQEFLKMLLV